MFFYPRANTPGCTAQSCNLNDNYSRLTAQGYEVIGVSPDTVDKQNKFAEKFGFKYNLLADDSKEIINNKNLTQTIHKSINELWNFCKEELLSGKNDQVILDEIFLALEMKLIDKDELISTLENRFITGDVILTGTSVPNNFLLMADQITELRS